MVRAETVPAFHTWPQLCFHGVGPLPANAFFHRDTVQTSSSRSPLGRGLIPPDSLGAKLVQGEPHESTGFGDGELLILLCELAALFDGFVEGLLLPSRVVF